MFNKKIIGIFLLRLGAMILGTLCAIQYCKATWDLTYPYKSTYGFGLVGAALGLYLLICSRAVKMLRPLPAMLPLLFFTLGMGFSCLIHLWSETQAPISKVGNSYICIAVAAFVYMFWCAFFLVRELDWLWLKVGYFGTFVTLIYSVISNFYWYTTHRVNIIFDPSICVVFLAAGAILIFCLVKMAYSDEGDNIVITALCLLILMLSAPCALVFKSNDLSHYVAYIALTFTACFILYFIFGIFVHIWCILHNQKRKPPSLSVQWINLILALSANFTIYPSIISAITYALISERLFCSKGKNGQERQEPQAILKAFFMAVMAALIYLLFFSNHPFHATSNPLAWGISGLIASFLASMCLYERKENGRSQEPSATLC